MTVQRVFVLCGLPGSGKTTWVNQYKSEADTLDEKLFVYSTDDYIESLAASSNLTYNEVFCKDLMKSATQYNDDRLEDAFSPHSQIETVIWDQTNLTKKKRQSIMSQINDLTQGNGSLWRTCVHFPIMVQEYKDWKKRLDSRKQFKKIPTKVLEDMVARYQTPSNLEGFSEIRTCPFVSSSPDYNSFQ